MLDNAIYIAIYYNYININLNIEYTRSMGLAPEVTSDVHRTELQRRSSEESLSELLGGVNTRSGSILGLAEGTRGG